MNESANCKTKIMQLLRIFKEEAKFLRAGKLIDVTDLSSSKMTAVSDVEMAFNAVPNVETDSQLKPYLQTLHKVSQENARLLQSAMAGARAAKDRLTGLQLQHSQIGTYDKSGQKHNLAIDHINSNKIV